MKALAACALFPLLLAAPFAAPRAQEDEPRNAEHAAVERAVRDYVEGIYQVKPELIERSVHPALEKFGTWRPDGQAEYRIPGKMTFEQLVALAGSWNAEGREGLTYEIEVLDALDVTASAKLTADWGIDYMHLMKRDGTWKIVQVLWQSKPTTTAD